MARTRKPKKKEIKEEPKVEIKKEEVKVEVKEEEKPKPKVKPATEIKNVIKALDIVIEYCDKQTKDFRYVAGVANHQMVQKCLEYKQMLIKKN